jgi:hypothetical protein
MTLTIDDARELTDAARERGAQPRVHPNGFIQLDLKPPADERWHEGKQAGHSGADLRLHVWNPPDVELPYQDTVNEIHDHVFDMFSTVVRGQLVQSLYEFIIGGIDPATWVPYPLGHELYRAVYDKTSSSRLEPLGVRGHLKRVVAYPITAEMRHPEYTQRAFTLHDSDAGSETVVTLMQKQQVHEGIPTVVCPLGSPPDNDFDRATAAPQDLLWDAIDRSLS